MVTNTCCCTCVTGQSNLLQVSKPAPDFTALAVMPDGEEKTISLSDYKGKYVVLFFYPLDFTFVCPTEIIAFDNAVEKFKSMDCEVIGVSCDSHFTHAAWVNTPRNEGGIGKLKYPLIADFTKELTRKYGCLMDEGHPSRGLFIIDGKGNLRHITINDPPVGRSVDETMRLVEAFKFTDEYPGVCPANWKKGGKTINPKQKKEYFESEFSK